MGIDLVNAAIAAAKGRSHGKQRQNLTPVSAALAKKLVFEGGAPVPDSVRRWLAFDSGMLGWRIDRKTGKVATKLIGALLGSAFPDTRDGDWSDFEVLLPARGIRVPGGEMHCEILYLGNLVDGEYPVLAIDNDGAPMVTIYSPGFDVWLAERYDALDGWERDDYGSMFDHAAHKRATLAQAKANLHGLRQFELGQALPKKLRQPAQKPVAQSKDQGALPDGIKDSITALAKRRKKTPDACFVAAMELAGEKLGRLDLAVAKQVAAFVKLPEGAMMAEVFFNMLKRGQIAKPLRLHR